MCLRHARRRGSAFETHSESEFAAVQVLFSALSAAGSASTGTER